MKKRLTDLKLRQKFTYDQSFYFWAMQRFDRKAKLRMGMEVIWLLITAVIVVGIMYPIWRDVDSFPFNTSNVIHIAVFITFTRYIFQLKHTWLAKLKWVKVVLAILCIYLLMIFIRNINAFTLYAEQEGLQAFMSELPHRIQWPLMKYIRTEYLFFAVACAITTALLPIRLLISIWRSINRKNKV